VKWGEENETKRRRSGPSEKLKSKKQNEHSRTSVLNEESKEDKGSKQPKKEVGFRE